MYNTLVVGTNLIIYDGEEKEKYFSEIGISALTVTNSDAHAMAMLRRGSFDLILLDAKYDALILEMAEAGISVPIIVFAESCSVQQARLYIRHGVMDLLAEPSEPEELVRSIRELSPRLQAVRPVHLKEIEALAEQLYEVLKNSVTSKEEVSRVFRSITLRYREHDEYRTILAAVNKKIERRFATDFSWVLLLYPFNAPDPANASEPEPEAESFYCGFSEKIKVFRLEKQNAFTNSVCRYLVENLAGNPSSEAVAKLFGVSKSSLSSLFFEQLGISFRSYRHILRQEYAKHMLLNSTYRVQEIGRLLGFQSTDYFREQFRIYEGCTPSEFRRKNGIGPTDKADNIEAGSR